MPPCWHNVAGLAGPPTAATRCSRAQAVAAQSVPASKVQHEPRCGVRFTTSGHVTCSIFVMEQGPTCSKLRNTSWVLAADVHACSRRFLFNQGVVFPKNDGVVLISDTAIGLYGQGSAKPLQTHFFTSVDTHLERPDNEPWEAVRLSRIHLNLAESKRNPIPSPGCINFPVRPAFAVTIIESRGQTFSNIGINLPVPRFSYGQL
eukprot:341283-Chlamydomonas_euryale.AAC.9